MKVKCIHNTGKVLLDYQRRPDSTSRYTTYGELEIGRDYIVMGIILREGYLIYIIDVDEIVYSCPNYLFEVVDEKIPKNWYFKSFNKDFYDYQNKESIFGYKELVFDNLHYENLVEMDSRAIDIYFKRKEESLLLLDNDKNS